MVIPHPSLVSLQCGHLCELQPWRYWPFETFPSPGYSMHHTPTFRSHTLGGSHSTLLRRRSENSWWFISFEPQRSNLQITDFLAILYQFDPNYFSGSFGLRSLRALGGGWTQCVQVGSGWNCALFGPVTDREYRFAVCASIWLSHLGQQLYIETKFRISFALNFIMCHFILGNGSSSAASPLDKSFSDSQEQFNRCIITFASKRKKAKRALFLCSKSPFYTSQTRWANTVSLICSLFN